MRIRHEQAPAASEALDDEAALAVPAGAEDGPVTVDRLVPDDDEDYRVLARSVDTPAGERTLLVAGELDDVTESAEVLGGSLLIAVPLAAALLAGLAARIAREGCLVTEFPPGMPPLKHHFPRRNRIIAGLARIPVVVQAAERSGGVSPAGHPPAAGRPALRILAGHRRVDAVEGIVTLHREVAAAGERRPRIQHLPPGVRPLDPLRADPVLGPVHRA